MVALDQLSNGRMILGVGIGDPEDPFMERRSPRVLAEMLDEAGNMLVPAVRRRILRWDGSCAYKGPTDAPQQITPEDVRRLRDERELDVKVSGGDPAAFAEAGATWWGRWIPPGPVDDAVAIIRQGPPVN